MKATKQLFRLGKLLLSRGVAHEIVDNQKFHRFVLQSLRMHSTGKWGDLSSHDLEMNDFALKHKERIVSAYNLPPLTNIPGQDKIWIITEWDMSATTILFPSEY